MPELPSTTDTHSTARAFRRLYLRRWLVGWCGLVLLALVAVFGLAPVPAALAFGLIALGAALVPREGLFLPSRQPSRAALGAEIHPLLGAVLEGLPEPAILLTLRGQVWSFNGLARDMLPGLRQGAHISAALREPALLDAVAGGFSGEGSRHVVVIEERVPIHRHIEATVSFLGEAPAVADDVPGILLFLRDLTEQERLNRLRSEFIANASHELRTPLASVLGFIETLNGAARNDPAAQQRFLGIMVKQAERMARLIDNLLSLSRVEMRQHLRPQTRVDLREVIGHVLASMEPLAAASGITVLSEGVDTPAIVLGDRDELVQLFANLVQNAIKYGRPQGHVWIALERAGQASPGRFAVSVRDEGPGIAPEHLPRLTERFYRAGGNGGEAAGTGLGLAIAKHVVARHRGELSIVSTPGEGSTFTVLLDEAPA